MQNPHTKNPGKLWKMLEAETGKVELGDSATIDKKAMTMLKQKLRKSRSIEVK